MQSGRDDGVKVKKEAGMETKEKGIETEKEREREREGGRARGKEDKGLGGRGRGKRKKPFSQCLLIQVFLVGCGR